MSAPLPVRRAARVRCLVRKYGWNPTAPQILDGGYRFWFGPDALIAYVDTGSALVVAGAPLCDPLALRSVTGRFIAAAARQKRAVAFFGVQQRFLDYTALPALPVGELLSWRPENWRRVLQTVPSLREQLRRARAKGVRIEVAEGGLGSRLPAVRRLQRTWLQGRGLPPMSFLAEPVRLTGRRAWDRTHLLAFQGDRLLGHACLRPIPASQGALIQEWMRAETAPNGTIELLLDGAFRAAETQGLSYATLGLSPLAGDVPPWLRAAAALGRCLFNFEGLARFKSKLRPDGRQLVALAGAGASPVQLVLETLRAFAGGSLLSFGAATLRLRAARLVFKADGRGGAGCPNDSRSPSEEFDDAGAPWQPT